MVYLNRINFYKGAILDDGESFLRTQLSFSFEIKNKMKKVNALFFFTNWQLNMLVQAEHSYFDGSFSNIPYPFKQMLLILDRDI